MPTYPNGTQTIQIQDKEVCLLPEKAVFLPGSLSLLIADPHFGKAAHFRKSGIPVTEKVHIHDFLKIQKLIESLQPTDIYFLGDLFHSDWNESWNDLEAFAGYFPVCQFHLIKGNHDILPEAFYRSEVWNVHPESLVLENYILTHEPMESVPDGLFNFCGHIHPGISLFGAGKQRLTLPCYFLSGNQMILPAFGRFTGLFGMKCEKSDQAFAVTDKKVIPVNFMQ
ncbi:ligase-associated DNA damage response endonuclease PdeM [Aquiflexum sp. LQ15W]|uniref:ligase-associated DNA damage response endonuclease PdeM n=1 Tax=Cognataquiflexum nitidum TaxID=2922272 RepID=UPI001F13F7A6|nr:ligase-associated DNA damage response endonuclease PdeM [Cognataquiflexum nitidum]MCH6199207.1 ligase-associated DNA damage response endonuclease PdeM [Cognataquiflexum nitidum]